MEFSRQEYCSGLSFPSPGDLPDPRIEPGSPTLQVDSLPSESLGKPRLVQPLWKTVWRCLRKETKPKIRNNLWPSISMLGYIIRKKKTRTLISKDTCSPMFTAPLSTIAKIWKQSKCPLTGGWIKKWCIYTQLSISHKNGWKFAIYRDMNGLGGDGAKWNKSDRERQILYVTYM